ncbi:MAG: GPR endopeptidase [Bacillota bacterium]|nr:GPR endopeptidase [Bacillota bacterium]
MSEIHTDLALEAHEYFSGKKGGIPPGVTMDKRSFGGLRYTSISVTNEEGSRYLEKPLGTYITVEAEDLRGSDPESYKQSRNFIAREIETLLKKNGISENDPVLVIGLGNWDITPDALGPKVVSALFVSRHLFEHLPEVTSNKMRPVSAISPGVLGTTGIETLEIVRGIVERTQPKCVIAIDALVSRSIERLGKSLQISDSGINPGSGVGNHRKELSKNTLGVPVISIGVPTVVDAATIADDIFEGSVDMLKNSSKDNNKFYSLLSSLSSEERKSMFSAALSGMSGELIVTPKDIDEMISDISDVVSSALNVGLHSDDISSLMQ